MGCSNKDYYLSINGTNLKSISGVEITSAALPVEQQTEEYDAAGANGWGKSCPLGTTATFEVNLFLRGSDPAGTMAALEALADRDETVPVIFCPWGDNGGTATALQPNKLFNASVVTFGEPNFTIKESRTLELSFPVDGEILTVTS
jgi:hypothetical protein